MLLLTFFFVAASVFQLQCKSPRLAKVSAWCHRRDLWNHDCDDADGRHIMKEVTHLALACMCACVCVRVRFSLSAFAIAAFLSRRLFFPTLMCTYVRAVY